MEGNGQKWELVFVMAAGPELVHVVESEKAAMERAAAIRARRDDWILLSPDLSPQPSRLQFPRAYNTAIRIREHRPATPAAPPAPPKAEEPAKAPAEAPKA